MSKYKTVKGFNDTYNTEYKIGRYIKDIIIEISETYNYKPLELSEFEYTSLFTDFYGNEIEESLFTINNRYSTSISLRYDNILSILRSIIENKFYVDKTLPIKLMCDTKTYKFNKKNHRQKARNEEFVFLNANCDSCYLDVENINIALDVFYALGMEEIDLVLYKNKIDEKSYKKIKKALDDSGVNYIVKRSKQMSYYDKLEYEFYYNETLLAKGGRHDYLAQTLQAPTMPSSSLTFDIDEMKNIIEFTSLIPAMEEELDFLVVSTDNNYDYPMQVASRLRELGVKVDINYNEYDSKRIRDFIDRMSIPYTIFIDESSAKKGIVLVRNSISKEEGNVYFEDFINELIEHNHHYHKD